MEGMGTEGAIKGLRIAAIMRYIKSKIEHVWCSHEYEGAGPRDLRCTKCGTIYYGDY